LRHRIDEAEQVARTCRLQLADQPFLEFGERRGDAGIAVPPDRDDDPVEQTRPCFRLRRQAITKTFG